MILNHEAIPAVIESLNGNDTGWNIVGICDLNDVGLYKATTKKLPISLRAASNFVINRTWPADFIAS